MRKATFAIAVIASTIGSAPTSAQTVDKFTNGQVGCPTAAIYEQFSKAVGQGDIPFAVNIANKSGCSQFDKGDKYIIIERKGWLCFAFREPEKFTAWHTCR